MIYAPRSLAVVSRVNPVSVFTAETFTPGNAAPLGSVTFPTSEPYSVCAGSARAKIKQKNNREC